MEWLEFVEYEWQRNRIDCDEALLLNVELKHPRRKPSGNMEDSQQLGSHREAGHAVISTDFFFSSISHITVTSR